jgi:sigma-54 dependent transcriptional regulator, dga operon transcriptional activator
VQSEHIDRHEQKPAAIKRRDAVLIELERQTRQVAVAELIARGGIDAETLGDNLGYARNSVSADLNALFEEGKVIKIKQRPVLFFHRAAFEDMLNIRIEPSMLEVSTRDALDKIFAGENQDSDPFSSLIGYGQSLKKSVEKGKAAVLYPPNGLNVMLTGPSGVGKSYFAELMHAYYESARDVSIPFIYFNCSEYFNNPELLTSHLFGHQQGAFTGATNSKEGIIAKAEGGFLFLDEVHRLPFEGQEKLFSILDKGVYRKLGSSDKEISSKIRLVCATTENIKSALLKTFLRRIQVVIDLPRLAERSFDERLEMIIRFFQSESRKVGLPIRVGKSLLGHLLCKDFEANIGELKSAVQFICAQAYANQFSAKKNELTVDESLLEDRAFHYDIRTKLLLEELVAGDHVLISPVDSLRFERPILPSVEGRTTDLFYSYLSEEYVNLQHDNIPASEISLILRKKLQTVFDHKIHNMDVIPLPMLEGVIGLQIEQKVKLLTCFIESLTSEKISEIVAGHLRNHIITLLAYIKKGKIPGLYSANLISESAKTQYDDAKLVCRKIEEIFLVPCPPSEMIFMCMLLAELKSTRYGTLVRQNCGVILIAHGDQTASSMAQYVNKLFGANLVLSINMPFEQSVHDTLTLFIKEVLRYQYKKLILAVDLGSLEHFGSVIRKMFKIETLLIKNITMTGLLELAANLSYETNDLALLGEMLERNGVVCDLYDPDNGNESRVILISCSTGSGTATKIRTMIEDVFDGMINESVRLETVDHGKIEHLDQLQDLIGESERLAGIIGTFQPNLPDVPFLSLEELFSEHGAELLLDIIDVDMKPDERELMLEKVAMKFISTVTLESIVNHITVLNPSRVLQEIEAVYRTICQQLDIIPLRKVTLRFMIHCCCMVERIVIDRKPIEAEFSTDLAMDAHAFYEIKNAFIPIESAYNIKLSDSEYYYIYELLLK